MNLCDLALPLCSADIWHLLTCVFYTKCQKSTPIKEFHLQLISVLLNLKNWNLWFACIIYLTKSYLLYALEIINLYEMLPYMLTHWLLESLFYQDSYINKVTRILNWACIALTLRPALASNDNKLSLGNKLISCKCQGPYFCQNKPPERLEEMIRLCWQ